MYQVQGLRCKGWTEQGASGRAKVLDCENLTLRRGMLPDIYNSLAERMNFTYTLQRSRDGNWGSVDRVVYTR